MCLAKVFINNSGKQPIIENIAFVRVQADHVELETLFGETKVVAGRLVEIDFSTSKLLLDEYHETAKS